MPKLPDIVAALADHQPDQLPTPADARNRACVAMVFAGPADSLSLCFIRRTERADDRWSGQMAFPGGRAEVGETPPGTAERETREEVGLSLSSATQIGTLSEVPLRPIVNANAVLSPFVHYVGDALPALTPEPREIAAAFWIPVDHLWSPDHQTTIDWTHKGRSMTFPGIQWGSDTIWGLTHRVLTNLAELLERPLPA